MCLQKQHTLQVLLSVAGGTQHQQDKGVIRGRCGGTVNKDISRADVKCGGSQL